MAITKLRPGSVAEEFTAEAPDAKAAGPKLRGRRQPIALALPPELIAELDAMASAQERSRAKMLEILLRGALERARAAA
jgi:Ribbon-helix-helix protein, copG family